MEGMESVRMTSEVSMKTGSSFSLRWGKLKVNWKGCWVSEDGRLQRGS